VISCSSCDVYCLGSPEGRQTQHIITGSSLGSRYIILTSSHDLICSGSHVTDWLRDIGLPQYRDIFIDGLVDGIMLNELSYVCLSEVITVSINLILSQDDLSMLQVNVPFHQVSLKRAIQAWRCDGNSLHFN